MPLLALLVMMALATVSAAAETARQLLDEAKAKIDAKKPKDAERAIHMTLTDPRGAQRTRELTIYSIEKGGDQTKTMIFIQSPADVKGVAVLSWAYPDKESDQWLYLPALGRVRRITGNTRKESFQGSDFTYTDFELLTRVREWTEEKAPSAIVKESETEDGVACTVISLAPKDESLDYGKLLLWVNRADGTIRKIEIYARADGALTKILRLTRFPSDDEYPAPRELEMTSVAKGSKTVLDLSNVRYDQGLAEDLFAERSLERGRID
jgi:outer membrane lipoprotein-sorting protein